MSVRGDHVWLGGPRGVQLLTQGHFPTMKWKDSILPGRVSGVVETKAGDLWVNGFSGVAHVSGAESKKWLLDPGSAVSAEHFDELDGLPGLSGEKIPEPSVVEASDGRVWFATTGGIASVDPAALEKNRNRLPPQVVVLAIRSNGKAYPGASGLTLPKYTENLEIDYTALSLAIPERVRFRYRLEGVDRDWQDVGTRRQAYDTILHPGQYGFQVMACNNDGVWNEAGALVSFALAPAWFQTAWFRLFCAAVCVAIAWLLHRLRVRQIAAESGGCVRPNSARVQRQGYKRTAGGIPYVCGDRKRALKPLLRDEIYSIGREGLINAFRHAHAHRVEIELNGALADASGRLKACPTSNQSRRVANRGGTGTQAASLRNVS